MINSTLKWHKKVRCDCVQHTYANKLKLHINQTFYQRSWPFRACNERYSDTCSLEIYLVKLSVWRYNLDTSTHPKIRKIGPKLLSAWFSELTYEFTCMGILGSVYSLTRRVFQVPDELRVVLYIKIFRTMCRRRIWSQIHVLRIVLKILRYSTTPNSSGTWKTYLVRKCGYVINLVCKLLQ